MSHQYATHKTSQGQVAREWTIPQLIGGTRTDSAYRGLLRFVSFSTTIGHDHGRMVLRYDGNINTSIQKENQKQTWINNELDR